MVGDRRRTRGGDGGLRERRDPSGTRAAPHPHRERRGEPARAPPNQLTQPGDISAALTAPGTGLILDASPDAVREIATDDLPNATTALAVPFADPSAYDVLIYFAHRIPNGANGTLQQADFTSAVSAFLVAGGGVISFHHGSYSSTGKAAILDLIGGTAAGAVPWNTVDGQNVINVAPGHFITDLPPGS